MSEDKDTKISRRSFLRTTAAGAAAVGALATAPTVLSAAENAAGAVPGDSTTPVMAFVRDASKGEVVVMWGTKEFVARDTALVSRLATYTRE